MKNPQRMTNEEEILEASDEEEARSAQELLGEPEPWESWETKLIGWSMGIGIIGLVILGYLINTYLLK